MIARPHNRTPIDLTGEGESYFAGVECRFNFGVGQQLPRCIAGRERYLNFLPNRVESISRHRINHRNERLTSWESRIRLIDEVQGLVVLKQLLFSIGKAIATAIGGFLFRCPFELCAFPPLAVGTVSRSLPGFYGALIAPT